MIWRAKSNLPLQKRTSRRPSRAAKRKKTISHLSKKTRTALGKQGAKVAKEKRAA